MYVVGADGDHQPAFDWNVIKNNNGLFTDDL
jgi:hypothetical protein